MSSPDSEERIKKLVLTIRSRSEGYSNIPHLLRDFNDDYNIDGVHLAKSYNFSSFDSFLRSTLMKNYIELCTNTQGQTVFKARHSGLTAHIEEQQLISARAHDQKIERDRIRNNLDTCAGTIGRKFYNDCQPSFNSRLIRNNSNNYNNQSNCNFDSENYESNYFNSYENRPPNQNSQRYNDNDRRFLSSNNNNDNTFYKPFGYNNFTESTHQNNHENNFEYRMEQNCDENRLRSSNTFNTGLPSNESYSNKKTMSQNDISSFSKNSNQYFEQNIYDDKHSKNRTSKEIYSNNYEKRQNEFSDNAENKLNDRSSFIFYKSYDNDNSRTNQREIFERNPFVDDQLENEPPSHRKFGMHSNVPNFQQKSSAFSNDKKIPPKMQWCDDNDDDFDKVPDDNEENDEENKIILQRNKSTNEKLSSMKVFYNSRETDDDTKKMKKEDPFMLKYTRRASDGSYTDSESTLSNSASKNNETESKNNPKKEASNQSKFSEVESSDSGESAIYGKSKKSNNVTEFKKPEINNFKDSNFQSNGVRAFSSHGEKWLVELEKQNKKKSFHKNNNFHETSDEEIIKPTAKKFNQTNESKVPSVADSSNFDTISRNKSNSFDFVSLHRSESISSITSTNKRARSLNEEDLVKLSSIVNAIVQYNYPRTILLEDLLDVMELIEPRFITLESLCGFNHVQYLNKYCHEIQIIGKIGKQNLLWSD